MEWSSVSITAIAAFGGLLLGIINLVRSLVREKVKLDVRVQNSQDKYIAVTVVNLSSFPVVIRFVELTFNGLDEPERPYPQAESNVIEPRHVLEFIHPLERIQVSAPTQGGSTVHLPTLLKRCVVETQCGARVAESVSLRRLPQAVGRDGPGTVQSRAQR